MVEDPTSKIMQDTEAMLEEIMIMMDERKHDWTKRTHASWVFCKVKLTPAYIANVRQKVILADKEIKRLLGCEKCKCP